jgi:hypothetical protein
MMRLRDNLSSGNGYKVCLLLAQPDVLCSSGSSTTLITRT